MSVLLECQLVTCYLMPDFKNAFRNQTGHPSPSLVSKIKPLTEKGNAYGSRLVEGGPVVFSMRGRLFCLILDPRLHRHVTSPTLSLGVGARLHKTRFYASTF